MVIYFSAFLCRGEGLVLLLQSLLHLFSNFTVSLSISCLVWIVTSLIVKRTLNVYSSNSEIALLRKKKMILIQGFISLTTFCHKYLIDLLSFTTNAGEEISIISAQFQ